MLNNADEIYNLRLIPYSEDEFMAIGWLNRDKDSNLIGGLSSPYKVTIKGNRVTIVK